MRPEIFPGAGDSGGDTFVAFPEDAADFRVGIAFGAETDRPDAFRHRLGSVGLQSVEYHTQFVMLVSTIFFPEHLRDQLTLLCRPTVGIDQRRAYLVPD